MRRAALYFALVFATAACSPQVHVTNSPKTIVHQLLVTEAIERAVNGLHWPRLDGRLVSIRTVAVGDAGDSGYLEDVYRIAVERHGGRLARDGESADVELTVFGGAIGTNEQNAFVGMPPSQSVIIPVTTPEIALYKSWKQFGFAKARTVARDARSRTVVFESPPSQATTYWHHYAIFGFPFHRTNTSWKQGLQKLISRDGEESLVERPPPRQSRSPWWEG